MSVITEDEKLETYSTIFFFFSSPGVYKSWGSNLAPSSSKTSVPDYHARPLHRDTVLFSDVVISPLLIS